MEFLVRIDTVLPPDLPDATRSRLLEDEAARGRDVRSTGQLRAIWRLPGRLSNVGIWAVADAGELDALLTSLPLARWQHVEVTALADHPLMGPASSHDVDPRRR